MHTRRAQVTCALHSSCGGKSCCGKLVMEGIVHNSVESINSNMIYLCLCELLFLALQVCVVLPLQLHLVLKVSLHTHAFLNF